MKTLLLFAGRELARCVLFFGGAAILLVSITACSSDVTTNLSPPTIHYGEDICEFCGMIVSEERYAAGYLTRDGGERIFDDIGGMILSHLQQQEDVTAFFVHDYDESHWIRAETAHYVLSPDLMTPMLHGVAACATTEKATRLAEETNGRVVSFEQLLTHFQEQASTDPHNHRMNP
jgi:copper chaperone NosL